MRENDDWAPWFRELAQKIADGGEQYLIEKAKLVAWTDSDKESTPSTYGLLRYGDENIDPLSFFYTLASRNRSGKSREPLYASVAKVFGMGRQPAFDHRFIFPTPNPQNTLFHNGGTGNPPLLWNLFREAVRGIESVTPEHFERALDLKGVATRKLTQALFLINPEDFLPFDDQIEPLSPFDSVALPGNWQGFRISWTDYRDWIDEVRASFPGCWLCEANLLAWLMYSGELSVQASSYFQVSTNAFNDGKDRWEEFESSNCVFTGDKKAFSLDKPRTGDIVLVRFEPTEGRGIGVVHRNDYQEGFHKERRLHVVWLNKTPAKLSGSSAKYRFSRAHKRTIDAFRGTDQNPGIHLYTHERVRPEAYGSRAVQLTWAQPRPEISAAWARADSRAA